MSKQLIEIELTFEQLYLIEQAANVDTSVNTVEEFIEKYSVLAVQHIVFEKKD